MSGEPYYPPVDPGGGAKAATQKGSTAASSLGFLALVASGTGDQVTAALGLGAHSPHIASAGISFASLANTMQRSALLTSTISATYGFHLRRCLPAYCWSLPDIPCSTRSSPQQSLSGLSQARDVRFWNPMTN